MPKTTPKKWCLRCRTRHLTTTPHDAEYDMVTALKYPVGTQVRFVTDGLGASERDNLGRVTSEVYGIGDTGTVHYAHPNPQCKGWFYVEVESRRERGHKLYVGVAPHMVEPV